MTSGGPAAGDKLAVDGVVIAIELRVACPECMALTRIEVKRLGGNASCCVCGVAFSEQPQISDLMRAALRRLLEQ